MLQKVLIANRGEIAIRIARTLRELGIESVAVFSEADRAAPHVRAADEAYFIGAAPAKDSYLNIERLVSVAKKAGCDGLHPGYGFVSENPDLVEACERAGLIFIGPPAQAMATMGNKTRARRKMAEAGVPIVPGGSADTPEQAKATAALVGYPVLLKAAAGGGGKGMRLVRSESELEAALGRAQSEAQSSFGDGSVYVEKAIERARHVEIQVLGDRGGSCVHLFERDCSIQRRHQKVLEETPCPALSPGTLERMGEVAVLGARAVGYYSAGTFEFLLAPDGNFYFLEMNTRLQVEHPITELVTGIDLVERMIRIAEGEPLNMTQADIVRRGAAIECRIYAEDPSSGFLPSPGTIGALRVAAGPGVRDDSGIEPGATIGSDYDPLMSKLCVWAPNRAWAIARMRRAIGEYLVTGVRTNLSFFEGLLAHPDFTRGDYDVGFVERQLAELLAPRGGDPASQQQLAAALAVAAALRERTAVPPAATDRTTSAWLLAQRARLRFRSS